MVAKGNKDGHRYTYTAGINALEKSKHGREIARERYGEPPFQDGAPPPPDNSRVQKPSDPNNLQGKGYSNDVKSDSWLRAAGEKQLLSPSSMRAARTAIRRSGSDDAH